MEYLVDFIKNNVWRFLHGDGSVVAPVVLMLPWGGIGGHVSEAERSWAMRDNRLTFLDANDVVTMVFFNIEFDTYGPVRIFGKSVSGGDTLHILERTRMPCAIDLGLHSSRQLPAFLKAPQAGSLTRNRNLVVLRANENSLHSQWARDIPAVDRNWDLCISWYGATVPDELGECEYFVSQPADKKWGAIHSLFLDGSPLWAYDRIWFPDDDLMTSWSDINRLFSIFRRYDLRLAQPALEANGNVSHIATVHNPGFVLRHTNFVEVMCPVFSADSFRICHPSLNGATTGYGLDFIWPRLLGGVVSKIAVIDDVVVTHTRPIGTTYDQTRAMHELIGLCALYGASRDIIDFGGLLKDRTTL